MARNNPFRNNFVTALSAAFAATILAPVVVPVIKRSARPLAKSLIKGGISLYEKSREAVAFAGEAMEDVIAEVKAEQMDKHMARADSGFGSEGTYTEAAHAQAARDEEGLVAGGAAGNGKGGAQQESRQGA